jgi:hypothetical protein
LTWKSNAQAFEHRLLNCPAVLKAVFEDGEEARTIEAYDVLADPVVEKIWGGKQLPFPVLVNGDGRTSFVYGI